MQKDSCGYQKYSSDREALYRNPWGSGAKPFTRPQAEKYRAKRWDEAQGEITAAVVYEARRARKEVQKPEVNRLAKVAVLVPVGGKPGEVIVPVAGNPNGGVIEVSPGSRIKRPRQPISKEYRSQRRPLPFRPAIRQQERECVSQANLGKCVFEGESSLPAMCGTQEDAKQNEHQASPDSVRQLLPEALAFA